MRIFPLCHDGLAATPRAPAMEICMSKFSFLFRYVASALKKFEIELRSVMEKEKLREGRRKERGEGGRKEEGRRRRIKYRVETEGRVH